MVPTQEALSVEEKLRRIPQYEFNNGCPLFKKHWMNRPICIGVIGLTGEGKTGSAAVIALIDNLLEGQRVWSNLEIKADFQISDGIAQKYGVPHGGLAHFESLPLEREKLLRFDTEYHGGALFLDEVNIGFAEAMRSMSNVNLWFNEVDQQRRKLDLDIYYTVIHEMWVDNRLRNMTDVFIKCEDPALSPEGQMWRRKLGLQVQWTIYPMTRYLTGQSYHITHQTLPPKYLQLRQFWGIFDTKKRQTTGGKYSQLAKDESEIQGKASVKQSPEVKQEQDEWGWLEESLTEIMAELQEDGRKEILRPELFNRLNIPLEEELKVGKYLRRKLQIRQSGPNTFYLVPGANLGIPSSLRDKEAVREKADAIL
jgi:hypothetical protein